MASLIYAGMCTLVYSHTSTGPVDNVLLKMLLANLDLNKRFNPIPTGLGHMTLIYGLIPPMASRNRVKGAINICI